MATRPLVEQFKAEQQKLQEAVDLATAAFRSAISSGDPAAAGRSCDALERAEISFCRFRRDLPREERLLLDAERIMSTVVCEKVGHSSRQPEAPRISLEVPSGVGDADALAGLNMLFTHRLPFAERSGILEAEKFDWLFTAGERRLRDTREPRRVEVQLAVPGTEGKNRFDQERILGQRGLIFATPLEQVLGTAALILASGKSDSPFNGCLARNSHEKWALGDNSHPFLFGFYFCSSFSIKNPVVASGVPDAARGVNSSL